MEIHITDSEGLRVRFSEEVAVGDLIGKGFSREAAEAQVKLLVRILEEGALDETSTSAVRIALDEIGGEAAETTIRTVLGIDSPDPSTALVDGEDWVMAEEREDADGSYVDVTYRVNPEGRPDLYLLVRDATENDLRFSLEPMEGNVGKVRLPIGTQGLDRGRWYSLDVTTACGIPVLVSGPLFHKVFGESEILLEVKKEKTEIQKLQELVNKLIQQRNDLIKTLDYFPLYRLSKILVLLSDLIALLSKIPPRVAIALVQYLRCRDKYLANLAVRELKRLAQILLQHAKLDLELEANQARKQELGAWIKELETRLNAWDDKQTKAAARKILAELKRFLKKNSPWILALLLEYYGDAILTEIEKLPGKVAKAAVTSALKLILKKVIQRLLVKRLGKELAKRFVPYVGLALSLAEFSAILVLVSKIDDLGEMIDTLLLKLIEKLVDKGWKWPSQSTYVWFAAEAQKNAKVKLCAWVACARKVSGKVVWDQPKPCKVKFAGAGGGSHCISAVLNQTVWDPKDKCWKVMYTFDKTSVESSKCYTNKPAPLACYTYIEVIITYANGKTETGHLIAGAMKKGK